MFPFREMPEYRENPASGSFPLCFPIGKCRNIKNPASSCFPLYFPKEGYSNLRIPRLRRFTFVFPYRGMPESQKIPSRPVRLELFTSGRNSFREALVGQSSFRCPLPQASRSVAQVRFRCYRLRFLSAHTVQLVGCVSG